MVATLLIWLYIMVVGFLYGWAALRLLAKVSGGEIKEIDRSFPLTWILGICVLTTLTSIFSLFMPISWLASAIILFLSLVIVGWAVKRREFRFEIKLDFRKWQNVLVVVIVLFAVLTILENATHRPSNPDSGIYHAQAIRWIEQFAAVPGLGNLHTRFAFNSSWMVANALFSFAFLKLQSFHLLNSVFFVVFILYLSEGLIRFAQGEALRSDYLRILLLPLSFLVLASEVSSPGTDLPAALMIWVILLEWLKVVECGDEKRTQSLLLLTIFSVFAVTIKLSTAPILLIALYSIWQLLRERKPRLLGLIFGLGVAVILPWMARNVVLSGYLAYPYPEIDLFNFDWKIPVSTAYEEKQVIMAWARIPNVDAALVLSMPLREWASIWFSNLSRNRIGMLALIAAAPAAYLLLGLVFRKTACRVLYALKPYGFAYLLAYGGVLFWFFTAPDFRFGYAFVVSAILMAVFPALFLLNDRAALRTGAVIGVILSLLMVYQVSVLYRSIETRTLSQRLLLPADYIHLTTAPCQLKNATVLCAEAYNECWYDPFPCVPFANSNVEMRGESYQDGFRHVSLDD